MGLLLKDLNIYGCVLPYFYIPYSQNVYIDAGDQDSGYQESGDQNTQELDMLQPYFDKIKETYDALSCKEFIHATPTLFHAGTPRFTCVFSNGNRRFC